MGAADRAQRLAASRELDALFAGPPERPTWGWPGPGRTERNDLGLEEHVDAVAGAVQRREHVGDGAGPDLERARRRGS